jgi:hypothetical protein
MASDSLSEVNVGWLEESSALSPIETARRELSLRLLLPFLLDSGIRFAPWEDFFRCFFAVRVAD